MFSVGQRQGLDGVPVAEAALAPVLARVQGAQVHCPVTVACRQRRVAVQPRAWLVYQSRKIKAKIRMNIVLNNHQYKPKKTKTMF